MAPSLVLCISSEALPEIKEYERTSTTVINAYVRPIFEKYLSTLSAELAHIGVDAPLLLSVTVKVVGRGIPDVPRTAFAANGALPERVAIAEPVREAYFGPNLVWRGTDVINRGDLAVSRIGPCIIEECDSACIVPPGATASLDRFGNIAIDLHPVTPGYRLSGGEQFDAP